MAFGTRQYSMGTAPGIMKTSDKWQSIIGGTCFPLSRNVLGLINCKERVSWKSINQGDAQLLRVIGCSAGAVPFWGKTGRPRAAAAPADAPCPGCGEDTGRGCLHHDLPGMATGTVAAREGRVVARERGGRRDALPRRAGTGAALPPGFAD